MSKLNEKEIQSSLHSGNPSTVQSRTFVLSCDINL